VTRSTSFNRALSEEHALERLTAIFVAFGYDEQSVPLFQNVARNHSSGGDVVYSFSAIASQGWGSATSTRDRREPRDSAVLIEPLWSDICGPDLRQASPASTFLVAMALAFGRSVCRINGKIYYLWRTAAPAKWRELSAA
jgi:hypothetical protein